jgi:hypothetical protein
MKGVILGICPDANIVDLSHDVLSFNIIDGARQFETIYWLPIGCHLCVVDPEVGTRRRAIAVQTKRGDYLIGPDNGVMVPAARKLGGIGKVVSISNEKYVRHPISTTFHGRDVFAPVAAWIARGVPIEEFGPELVISKLRNAAFDDAIIKNNTFFGIILHIHPKFGTVSTNITSSQFVAAGIRAGHVLTFETKGKTTNVVCAETFGNVPKGKALVFLDDYDRVSIAVNMGNFAKKYRIQVGDRIKIGWGSH